MIELGLCEARQVYAWVDPSLLPEAVLQVSAGLRTEDDRLRVRRTLAASPDAPGEARAIIRQVTTSLGRETASGLAIVVTELMSNAVRHAGLQTGDPISLTLDRANRVIRLEVIDRGTGFVPDREVTRPPRDAIGGFGLYLVSRLASRWGPCEGPRGIWVEFDLPD